MTAIDHMQAILQPIIADYAGWAILGVVGWMLRRLPGKWKVEIEAKHREALHRALETGTGLVIDTLQKHPAVLGPDIAAGQVIEYVRRSVPGAIRKLGPSQQQLEAMARSKIQAHLDAITGRDRLTEVLQQAMKPGS